jgi:NADPH:quinone reductase-like Zn-dependent oxidoreductase
VLAAGARAVIATDQDDVMQAVRGHTGGTGADLVLDLITGPGQTDLIKAVRPGGTLVAAGVLDPRPTPAPEDTAITMIRYRSFEHTLDPVVVRRMAAFLTAGVRLGTICPVIDTKFTLEDVVGAHRRLEAGGHTGKIVVTV